MTTKPKARKFRIRRAAPMTSGAEPQAGQAAAPQPAAPQPTAAAPARPAPQPGAPQPGARPAAAPSPTQARAAELARRQAAADMARKNPTPTTRSAAAAPGQPGARQGARGAMPQMPPQAGAAPQHPAAQARAAQHPAQQQPPAAQATPQQPRAAHASVPPGMQVAGGSPDAGAAPGPWGSPAQSKPQAQPQGQPQAQPQAQPQGQPQAQPHAQPQGQPHAQPGQVPGGQAHGQAAGTAVSAEQMPRDAVLAGAVDSPDVARADLDIDSIRKEGLTGRQLRMARRVAQKHGIAPTSDFDAVRQLRAKGIDPFERTNMLALVAPDQAGAGGPGGQAVQLPQTVPADRNQLPSTEMNPAERRFAEISRLQQELAARRRRRMLLLLTRLTFFIFAPTFLAGWYFFVVATPMYAAKSEFLILQADNQGGGGLGGLLSGTQFATNQDSIAVQSFLQSKESMQRLDKDVGFESHFSQPWIDPIQRLAPDASIEDAYKIFKRNVKIGYDPTEGVIRMEVAAADPAVAAQFSEALIEYAEERVDDLSRRKREDGMSTAIESLERSKRERREAQERLVRLQEGTFVDPEGIIAGLRAQINNVELQLQEKELQLAALQDNSRPNRARVDGVQGDVDRLRRLLGELKGKMTDATSGESSLAEKAAQIQMAQADLATADIFLQSALQNEKQTELEANRQVRYLTTSVKPIAPEDPAYPRAFENTLLAFLLFSGIYLMVSLTASILREQVSS